MAAMLTPVPLANARFTGGFWHDRCEVNRQVTLPVEYQQCRDTGRLDAWQWQPGQPHEPHVFWDSDVAKWIEAAAYSLTHHPDPEIEANVDAVVAAMAAAQDEDGYLNSHFQRVEPERRWACLRGDHELYCAGHLMEAAVAYHEATGKRAFLEVMCRYADRIAKTFGRASGQVRGYPGHEEIELALVKLYRATGEDRYLRLAKYFVDERGREPYYFVQEAQAEGREEPLANAPYSQWHAPPRDQTTAEGHAVRACYLYAGMADVAAETGDGGLLEACRALWRNVVTRRMYVTGGIGSQHHGERFTYDYDLPTEEAYAETCAAIALVFFAHRLLQVEPDGEYADVMERALYNGVLSGVSQSGDRFFYVNPLSQYPPESRHRGWVTERQEWFGCACCPPNLARLLASLPAYAYSTAAAALYVHLYGTGEARADVAGQTVTLRQETDYPWAGGVHFTLGLETPASFALALRVPGWARRFAVAVNGEHLSLVVDRGYARVERQWQDGDVVEFLLDMPVERLEAHPEVRQTCGRVAFQRGPVVYCFEEEDNGKGLADVAVPPDAPTETDVAGEPFPGIPTLKTTGVHRARDDWRGLLYRPEHPKLRAIRLTGIPYYLWANRRPGEMVVWVLGR